MHSTTRANGFKSTLIALAALGWIGCAGAQTVRKCQIEGHSVFQSSPCPVEARVATATPAAPAATDPAAPKKKTLADLLRERDGGDRGRPLSREFQGDGAAVLKSRMGAV